MIGWICGTAVWVLVIGIAINWLYTYLARLRVQRREAAVRNRLSATGRCVDWESVESQLLQGHGTLIIQHLTMKGPIREWWTPDDLIGAAPVLLPTSLFPEFDETQQRRHREYSAACTTRYVDPETGSALLTAVPFPTDYSASRPCVTIHLGDGWMTAVPLVMGRDLAGQYPSANVVTLIEWTDTPYLAMGDAELVLLPERRTVQCDDST